MERAQWLPAFETGIASVDDEHRRIFNLVTEMQDAVAERDLPRCRALAGVVMDRAEEHFAMEEWFLRANDFPRLETHRRYHRMLSREGRALAARVAGCDTPEAVRGLTDAFLRFILDDIIKGDMDFKSHVQEHAGAC